jgi:hypothetical protein
MSHDDGTRSHLRRLLTKEFVPHAPRRVFRRKSLLPRVFADTAASAYDRQTERRGERLDKLKVSGGVIGSSQLMIEVRNGYVEPKLARKTRYDHSERA